MKFLLSSILVSITSGHTLLIGQSDGKPTAFIGGKTGCTLKLFLNDKFDIGSSIETQIDPCLDTAGDSNDQGGVGVKEPITGFLENGEYVCKHGETQFATYSGLIPTSRVGLGVLGIDMKLGAEKVCQLIGKKYEAVKAQLEWMSSPFRKLIAAMLTCEKIQVGKVVGLDQCCKENKVKDCSGESYLSLTELAQKCIPISATDAEIDAYCKSKGILLQNGFRGILEYFGRIMDKKTKELYAICHSWEPVLNARIELLSRETTFGKDIRSINEILNSHDLIT